MNIQRGGRSLYNIFGEKVQTFVLQVRNEGGTLNHRIVAGTNNIVPSQYADKINGATDALTVTPLVDSVTAFAGGFGIFASTLYVAIFDTPDQTASSMFFHAVVESYDGGVSHPCVVPMIGQHTINGVNQNRLVLRFNKQSDGANFPLNATNIPAGSNVYVRVISYLK